MLESGSKTAGSCGKTYSRSEILRTLSGIIHHLNARAITGRFRDHQLERTRDSKTRLLIEVCKIHANILKDEELDDIKTRIDSLERLTSNNGGRMRQ